MAAKASKPESSDMFDSIEYVEMSDIPKRNAGRPPSDICLKFRKALEKSLETGKIASIPMASEDVSRLSGQMRRAGALEGMPEIKTKYRYDAVTGMFRFGPSEVFNAEEGEK